MNWVIFTTECSGKTTFCKKNNYHINGYNLIEWDKIKSIPNIDYENQLLMIDVLCELKGLDNKVYFVNFIPPNFILENRNYFDNIRFGIILLDKEQLESNIKDRHHKDYNSDYIINHYGILKNINEIGKLKCFESFKSFEDFINPNHTINLSGIKKRIIRL